MRRLFLTVLLVGWLCCGAGWLGLRGAMAQGPETGPPLRYGPGTQPGTQLGTQPGTQLGSQPGTQAGTRPGGAGGSPQTFWEIVKASGWVGLCIFGCSIAAVALGIEQLVTIRASVLMPEGLGEAVRRLLAEGNVAAAEEQCHHQPSFLAFVLAAGLGEMEGGWQAVEKAMEDATAERSARLLRRLEYLSLIGNIAPMLGLLGTVIGMVLAFHEVADTQGAARAADLAQGIYLALVTTVEGLIVAIPALGVFAIFRNRLDQLVAETAYAAQHAVGPLKRRGGSRRAPSATPPGPAPAVPPVPPRGGRP